MAEVAQKVPVEQNWGPSAVLDTSNDQTWQGAGVAIPPKVGGEFRVDSEALKG